jgi:Flp pilus assembly protein TadG
MKRLAHRLARDASGAGAVEFALLAPLFLILVCGILVYGVWFALAMSVQSLASDGARAALAGLDADERVALARGFVQRQAPNLGLNAALTTSEITADDGEIRVVVRFDASQHPVMAMHGLIPSPPQVIERTAVVETSE